MSVEIGLERLVSQDFSILKSRQIGLLCNQASIEKKFSHAIDAFMKAHQSNIINFKSVFGPQHGLWGHTQDNMIEWEGGFKDTKTGLKIYSLYGEYRKPTVEMFDDIDFLVVDLQDVGARYYTFVWTMALCMEACSELGKEMVVLDRPNPIGGTQIEGPLIDPNFRSFVGWQSTPVRHGFTIAEIAHYLKKKFYPDCKLFSVQMRGWKRSQYYDQTGLPWGFPSPNMPSLDTAIVYPGMCLLEATNISEGRGTTRPFEIFGAPWMDSFQFSKIMNDKNLHGVVFRPFQFQPTFNKYSDELCEGCYIHVTDRKSFKPFLMAITLITEVRKQYPENFAWKKPPYEYEYEKMPFDILVGNDWLRVMIDKDSYIGDMEIRWNSESEKFLTTASEIFLYG
jgi:uncharacterized protein YbbC (DUF1343 family)